MTKVDATIKPFGTYMVGNSIQAWLPDANSVDTYSSPLSSHPEHPDNYCNLSKSECELKFLSDDDPMGSAWLKNRS